MRFKNIRLIFLSVIFVFVLKEYTLVKDAINDGVNIWFKYIVLPLLPVYYLVDLMLNYGITKFFNNKLMLIILSFLLGAPSNTKYINEFLNNDLIKEEDANHLLFSIYSPSIPFILGLNYYSYKALIVIIIIDLILYIVSKRFFIKEKKSFRSINYPKQSFTEVIDNSTKKSFDILLLILGVICFYKIIIVFLKYLKLNFLINFIELTSACDSVIKNNLGFNVLLISLLFGGISIHTQVKSIINEKYKYFLFGRIMSLIIFFLINLILTLI